MIRSLLKKLKRSSQSHTHKNEMVLCLQELMEGMYGHLCSTSVY